MKYKSSSSLPTLGMRLSLGTTQLGLKSLLDVAFAEVPKQEATPSLLFQVSHAYGSNITFNLEAKMLVGLVSI